MTFKTKGKRRNWYGIEIGILGADVNALVVLMI